MLPAGGDWDAGVCEHVLDSVREGKKEEEGGECCGRE